MFKKIFKGFTLIELLVVIAIIAILAAILFPVFAQAREKARQTSCLSNMKQLGTATQLYLDDYEETYPPSNIVDSLANLTDQTYPWYMLPAKAPKVYSEGLSFSKVNNAWSKWTWRDSIFPYVKNINMYYCPSIKGFPSYGINIMMTTVSTSDWTSQSKTLSEIKNASQLVLYTRTQVDTGGGYVGTETYPNCIWIGASGCEPTHSDGDNITYADGHAKFCKKGQGAFSHNVGYDWSGSDLIEWNPAL